MKNVPLEVTVLVAFFVIPVLLAYLMGRADRCKSCGAAMIHKPDCTGHFDA